MTRIHKFRSAPPDYMILHLVVPGLLGPWSTARETGFPNPTARALERLLARAETETLDVLGTEATLFRLFGLTVDPERDLPVAAVTRLADGGQTDSANWWLRADPVHLHADLHQILLFDARTLRIEANEAEALGAIFNEWFAAEPGRLETLHPQRWYLGLENDPGLRTHSLEETLGQDINPLLPQGPNYRRWRTLLTEIQMLLHDAPVNAKRESRGSSPINSVWFWGSGRLPEGISSPFSRIYADDPLTRGLTLLTGTEAGPVPADARTWRTETGNETTALVVLETVRYDAPDNDPYRWSEHLQILEQDWFAPCLSMLADRSLARLYLYPCNGRVYTVTARNLHRFWRRTRSLLHYP